MEKSSDEPTGRQTWAPRAGRTTLDGEGADEGAQSRQIRDLTAACLDFSGSALI